jgi:hypothetical protein
MSQYELKYTETQPCTHFGLSLGLLAFGLLPVSGFAQVQPASSEQHVSETHDRVIFDRDAFFSGPIPYWSRGYLISRKVESFSAGTPNVTLYSRETGSKSAEVAFWFLDSQRIIITSAAVTHNNDSILALGEADKQTVHGLRSSPWRTLRAKLPTLFKPRTSTRETSVRPLTVLSGPSAT